MRVRGFSLIEVMIVAAIAATIAAVAFVSVSAAASRQRTRLALETMLGDVERVRNAHVATGRLEPLLICVDCVDETGGAHAPTLPNRLVFYVGENVADVRSGRVLFSGTYAGLTLSTSGLVAIDGLGRSVAVAGNRIADPVNPTESTLRILSEQVPHALIFNRDGRLQPSFAPEILPPPAHAQNFSERVSRNPAPRGRFSGDPDRAAQILLH